MDHCYDGGHERKRPSHDTYSTSYKKQRLDHTNGYSNGRPHSHWESPPYRDDHMAGYGSHNKSQGPKPKLTGANTGFISNGRSSNHNSTSSQPLQSKDLPALPPIGEKYQSPVFTHPSLGTQELSGGPMLCYDKLEFLGDAYIEIIATRLLWTRSDTKLTAARMSSIREGMVKNETLSEYAIAYGLDQNLNIPEASRPVRRDGQVKINGDVFEAYVAAVVLSEPENEANLKGSGEHFNPMDGPGFARAEEWLAALWEKTGKLQAVSTIDDEKSKGELQQKLGGKGVLIKYEQERERIVHKGKGIEQYFIGVYLTGWGFEDQHLGSGEGLSKKAAGMAAAKDALERNADLVAGIEKRKAKEKQDQEEKEARLVKKEESD